MAILPTVTIQAPADGSLVAPSSRDIVVDIAQPGTDPTREFHITVNAVTALTVLAGAVTFIAADYSGALITFEAPVERVTLTRASDWPDPSDLDITAVYRDATAGPIYSASSLCIAASYTFQAGAPYPGQPDVAPESSVSLSITTPATVLFAQLLIGGAAAFQFAPPDAPDWNTPDFVGRLSYGGGALSTSAKPRRVFDPEQIVDVELSLVLSAGGAINVHNSFLYQFHIHPSTSALFNPALRFTRLDRVFENAAASETLRYILRGALLPRTLSPSFEVALYLQILRSSLGAVINQFARTGLGAEVSRLAPEDIPDVTAVDATLTAVNLLWESVLLEAAELGLPRDFLQLVAKTYDAPYPQERVGAACAIVFAQAPLRS